MEGRYRVRALERAIAILRVLNQYDGLNATDLSRIVGLPRPTVLRLLSTLIDGSYVVRSEADGYFRSSLKVRELTFGFKEDAWLRNVVRPFLAELESELIWPLAVLRLYGTRMVVEALTDHQSEMLIRRDSPGHEVPLFSSASGYLYMALENETVAQRLFDQALAEEQSVLNANGMTAADARALIERTRQDGFAVLHLPTRSALAVPVFLKGELSCALVLRMNASPEMRRALTPRYIGELTRAAADLSKQIAEVIDHHEGLPVYA